MRKSLLLIAAICLITVYWSANHKSFRCNDSCWTDFALKKVRRGQLLIGGFSRLTYPYCDRGRNAHLEGVCSMLTRLEQRDSYGTD
jgi:hypothetical protein